MTDPSHADALYALAWSFYYGRDRVEKDGEKAALDVWNEAAEIGHLDSMYQLGFCHKNGWGCQQDFNLAFYWFKTAGEKGHLDSIYELGCCYKNGYGCERDSSLSFHWYQMAAQKGNTSCMVELGACYEHGHGCRQDSDSALEWWERAYRQGGGGVGKLRAYGRERIASDYSVGYKCLSIPAKHGDKDALALLLEHHQTSWEGGNLDEKIQKLRATHDKDPSDFVAAFLLAEWLSNSFKLKDLDEAAELLAKIPQNVPFYSRSQWLVPFLEEKKNVIFLSGPNQSFPDKSDFVNPGDLCIVALIGEGQFGKVYLAKYGYTRWVAVKYLNDDEFEEHRDAVNKLMRERLANQIVKARNSRNTVDYVGIVTDFKNKKSGLVFELCADLSLATEDAEDRILNCHFLGGFGEGKLDFSSLPDWRSRVPSSLRSTVVFARACPYSMAQLLKIFWDVAIALQCLHGLGILHRDIADRNVLCDRNNRIQLADFGMSRFVGVGTEDYDDQTLLEYSHKLTEGNQYAVAWWPPECLGDKPIFSFASDIYSFFVMVWQCLAGEDPFQSLLEGDGDPFVRVSEAILSGQRPDLDKLRPDTPDSLRNLMEESWAADPLRRPTLKQVVAELNSIMRESVQVGCQCCGMKPFRHWVFRRSDIKENQRVVLRRRGNQVERNWFDVQKMYLEMPQSRLIDAAQDAGSGSFPSSFLHRRVEEKLKTAPSIAALSESTIRLLGGRRPYDAFIVHAGEQKFTEASSLKRTLELAGYRCFLDRKMKNIHGSPADQMTFALATCRYIVVIVSKAFLTKKYPCMELQYAFDRAQWLEGLEPSRSHLQSWRSLHVILLDLSVEDYAIAQAKLPAKSLPSLPVLAKEVVMKEYASGQGKIEDWPTASEELGDELLSQDKEQGAVDCWNTFLQNWDSLSDRGFPWADHVYYDSWPSSTSGAC